MTTPTYKGVGKDRVIECLKYIRGRLRLNLDFRRREGLFKHGEYYICVIANTYPDVEAAKEVQALIMRSLDGHKSFWSWAAGNGLPKEDYAASSISGMEVRIAWLTEAIMAVKQWKV